MTSEMSEGRRKSQALKGALITAVMLILFFTIGSYLLALFGVSLAAVETVGGLVIGLTGWEMLRSDPNTASYDSNGDVAFYPLAFPLLAGPGSLALALGITNRHDSYLDYVGWMIGILGVAVVSYLCLRASSMITRRLGDNGVKVVTRIMGLVVLAIGAELVFNGIAHEFGLSVTG